MTKWFEFSQNNSGGHFHVDDGRGIGPRVWIQAENADGANRRAQDLGIYFDGVEAGRDCSCCGDRWSEQWSDGNGREIVAPDAEYDFFSHGNVYAHSASGTIHRITKDDDDKIVMPPALTEPLSEANASEDTP